MNINSVVELSINIITDYYNNDLTKFFEYMDDDVLWIGPAERQWISGKQNLVDAFANENNILTFKMGNISATFIQTSRTCCEIILKYLVLTNYPDGQVLQHNQRLQFTWVEKSVKDSTDKQLRIKLLHISNSFPYDKRDNIYPIHYESVADSNYEIAPSTSGPRLLVRDKSQSMHFLSVNTIMWIESYDNSTHTLIHMEDEDLVSIEALSVIASKNCPSLIRTHSSYMVNPLYVKKISRFQIEMTNGTVLPVPEKKYTAVKKELNDWITKWNSSFHGSIT
ncbi:MAG: LytTR family transcriptional regulator [Butyrivibrio sp.]|nr:LytTR family transcriptional regulator [Butyrivibrio sp.]